MNEQYEAGLLKILKDRSILGTIGVGTFLRGVVDYLKQLAKEQVDTEAERDAIVAAAMAIADKMVAAKFPPVLWGIIRPGIMNFLDQAIDKLPIILES